MKKTRLRTTIMRWMETLISTNIARNYDRLDYHILEEVIFNKKPNMAEVAERYGYNRQTLDAKLRKIEDEIKRLTAMVR